MLICINPTKSRARVRLLKVSCLNRLTDLENELMVAGREGWREEVFREPGINMYTLLDLKWITRDFPGGPGVKNPPSRARDVNLIPGQGAKTSHATGQQSPLATTTELQLDRSPWATAKT